MPHDIISIENIRKEFSYHNPGPNSNTTDMWVEYILGFLGLRKGQFAARREKTVALDGISLNVIAGEFFGLLGPNGAGKTTLIKTISTILKPNAGRILVNGFDTVRQAAQARASLSVVAASGWLSFDLQLTLTQNLVFWGRLCGLDRSTATERSHRALDMVDLGDWRDETPNHLSSGMRQRLAIAKGLLVHSPVFVLDEPTANVDPIIAYQIRDFLRNDLNRNHGQTIMLATHNMAEAEQLCDRVAIIDRGKMLICDRPSALVQALHGRIFEIQLSSDAHQLLAHLRDERIALRISDAIGSGGDGRLRLHLQPEVTARDLTTILEKNGRIDAVISDVAPNLEDVFVHHAGRSLHVDAESGTAA